jgi:hypothetical protein
MLGRDGMRIETPAELRLARSIGANDTTPLGRG